MVIRKTIVGNANGRFLFRLTNMPHPLLFLRLITIPTKPKRSTQPKHNADVLSRNKTISHLVRTGQISQAREAFDNMKQRDTVTWNSMITGYVKRGEMDNARKLFDEMPERDTVTWNSMITGYVKRGEIVNARKLFDEMPERDIVSWNVMIWGYTSSRISGFIEEGRSLFYQMPKRDSVSWSTMISGYAKNGRISEAIKFFNIMPEKSVGSWNSMITGFLQSGDLVRALEFFERMPERDVVSWTAMITGLLQNGDVVRAMEFFERMPQRDGDSLIAFVSGLVQNGELDKATRIAHESRNREDGMDGLVKAYNILIAGYGRKGRVEEARHLFDQIPLCHDKGNNGGRFERDIVSWNSMIMCYVKAGNVVSARELFDQMIHRDTFSWNTMISGYVHISNMEEASNIFRKMPYPNTVSWTSMMVGYAQVGCLDLARYFFQRMPQKDLFTWSSMIIWYEKNEDFKGAVMLFSQMQLEGERPDRHSLSSILSACTGLVDLHLGMQIHQLVTKTVIANMPINNSLITMYTRCGAINEAKTIFDEVKVQKDVISWNAMIAGYGYHGFSAEALELFIMMKGLNVKPTYRTFKEVLNAYKHAGLIEDGQSRMEQYASLVDIIGGRGHLEDAMHLINCMPCKPDKAVWEALLGACRVHNNVELAKVAAEALTRL